MTRGCSVITTNDVDGSGRPLGGLSWTHEAQYRLLMQEGERQGDESVYISSLQSATFTRPDLKSATAHILVTDSGPHVAHERSV